MDIVTEYGCIKTCTISSSNKEYRYKLTKSWDKSLDKATFIGINPSDANVLLLDKTVMNLMNYLINNGYGSVDIVNLYAYRSKKQAALKNSSKLFENRNINYIEEAIRDTELIIVGWGRDAETKYKGKIQSVKDMLYGRDNVKCFRDGKGHKNCHLSIGYSNDWTLVDYFEENHK